MLRQEANLDKSKVLSLIQEIQAPLYTFNKLSYREIFNRSMNLCFAAMGYSIISSGLVYTHALYANHWDDVRLFGL